MRKMLVSLFTLGVMLALAACNGGKSTPPATPAGGEPAAATHVAPPVVTDTGITAEAPEATEPAAATGGSAATEPVSTTETLTDTAGSDIVLTVIKLDGSSVPFKSADLKKLSRTKIRINSKVQEGPSVLDVLKAAGVTDFKQIVVNRANGTSSTLTKAQLIPQVILDFAAQGSVKIVGPNWKKDDWLKDVISIKVE